MFNITKKPSQSYSKPAKPRSSTNSLSVSTLDRPFTGAIMIRPQLEVGSGPVAMATDEQRPTRKSFAAHVRKK